MRSAFGGDSLRLLPALAALLAPATFAASMAVDVGHYLREPGAISARGVTEFEYNLRLALETAAALRQAGHEVRLIGDDGMAGNLAARARRADGTDLLISIHHDSTRARHLMPWEFEGVSRWYADDRFKGYSLFISRRNPRVEPSLRCATAIGAALRGAGFVPSRYHADPALGENRPFADEANGVHYFDNLALARTARVPAVLIEAGVILNRDEELRLREPAVRSRIVAGIVAGVEACTHRQARREEQPQ